MKGLTQGEQLVHIGRREDDRPTMILFAGSGGPTEIERMVARAQWATAVDTIEGVLDDGLCERVIVATGSAEFAGTISHLPVILEHDVPPFHFGRQLRSLVDRYDIHRPLYVGAGSTALLKASELKQLCDALSRLESGVIANNFWSADFAGFVPGDALAKIDLPEIDNNLAFLLNRQAHLTEIPFARTTGTQFDIDTPTDLLILAHHPRVGKHSRAYLESLDLDLDRVGTVLGCLTDVEAEVLVAGRVGSAAWTLLERETACRIRLFSEERGMRASGREDRGEARSLLGFYLERAGHGCLFDALAQLGNAAVIDSRVIFAHLGLRLSASDRFYSDLMRPDQIENPIAREFTEAARDAKLPVLLGGHSVVSGGLFAMIDAAWDREESGKTGSPR